MGIVGGGAQAEYISVHERLLMPVPAILSWEQAGSFPEAFITAHDALFTQADLRPGEHVLISGAAGGVGMAAVQIAQAAGATVVASVRSRDNHEKVAQLGRPTVVSPEDIGDHGPYDVVLELVGTHDFERGIRLLNTGGRIVVIGFTSGHEAVVNFPAIAAKRASLRASTIRSRPLEEKAAATRCVEKEILPRIISEDISVVVAAAYPFSEAMAAYEAFRGKGKHGKIVLTFE